MLTAWGRWGWPGRFLWLIAGGGGVCQLHLFPADLVAEAGEYEDGVMIQVSDRRWRFDEPMFIIKLKSTRIDASTITDDLRRIGIVWDLATKEKGVLGTGASACDVGMLGVVPQQTKPYLLSFEDSDGH